MKKIFSIPCGDLNQSRMIKPLKFTIFFMLLTILGSCSGKNEKDQLDNMKEKPGEAGLWLSYSKEATVFKLWSPDADKVRLNLYKAGKGGKPYKPG